MGSTLLAEAIVLNPKQERQRPSGRASWYPYYAGFSQTFAKELISSMGLKPYSRILDPWNGSGTTVAVALEEGHRGTGFDINPVMVVAAKARLLSCLTKGSLQPLLSEICDRSARIAPPTLDRQDPLSVWLVPDSCSSVRRIEAAIQHLLVKPNGPKLLSDSVNELSDLASFFYVALFRSLRIVLSGFFATNPTWVKKPRFGRDKRSQSLGSLLSVFRNEGSAMIATLDQESDIVAAKGSADVSLASSDSLPIEDDTIDCVITSPPYCTRIDYAVATSLELALLGIDSGNGLDCLRRTMIGTSTVPAVPPASSPAWGKTCLSFLSEIERHSSKASAGYYLKNHLQYFNAMAISISEISRVTRRGGMCILVVQDSHYKELHNNLPRICIEMGAFSGLTLKRRVDFEKAHTRASLNPHARQYRFAAHALESVLFLDRA